MEVIKITKHSQMASGRNYCALISVGGRQCTGFGKTEEEAIADAEKRTKGFPGSRRK